ncbi:hypothetical protein SNE40_020262 [Patella caerulea]|uniref:Unconventional myosin-XV n=1 Tax=Patella caerulea TaxID=87958 RepID=A0AAN8IZI2_PATCE
MVAKPKDQENEQEGVEDMIHLSDLNERSILENLRNRYAKELIYTYTGSILVAVNPYRMYNIYGLDMVKRYEGRTLGSLSPHLFAIASTSYSQMMKTSENQVIVISGESGAGKTESTKLVMQYLAAVNKSGNNLITEQIVEANPLLESFGNAKTIRNDNSSRFGKYIEVFFKRGSMVGARTQEYLLEKSRIVSQATDERNYHVFYEMLSAMTDEEKSKYGLQSAPKYFYLNQGGDPVIPGRDDAENFRKMKAAMDVLNFDKSERETVYKILSCVLHIGNIYFKSVQSENHDNTVELGSEAEIKWISYLLQLSEDWLKQALISKVTEARGDKVYTPYNLDQALDARDAISKALYTRLFTWLVEKINAVICRAERDKSTSLAVLDIFGFEDFTTNSFEQLCINYANETLQYFFNQHIFRLEQKEYIKEKIRWNHIEFKDNQPVIDLIATKPAGILHILDDESNFPQATDQSFLEKCHFHHASNSLYSKPRMSGPEFSITHYAGDIKYDVTHFLEKNKDTLRSHVVELMCESKNQIISQMFKDMRDRLITKTLSKTTGRYITLKPKTATVAASFGQSLLSLIDTMTRCNPYFVRCIKPNTTKTPMKFDDNVILTQLQYTGMMETVRIRKMGFPIRVKFPHFIERYRCLLKGAKLPARDLPSEVCAKILLTQGPLHAEQYQIGATKVFMKEEFEHHIDIEAAKIMKDAVIRIQKCTRTFLARNRFKKSRGAATKLQAAFRTWKARRDFKVFRNGIIRAQAQFRMRRQRRKYLQTREEIRRKLDQERLLRKKQQQEKMQREQQAKAAKAAAANVTNLDIPGELAFVFSKLDDWQLVHNSKHVITAVGDVRPMDMGYKLPVDINSHVFNKFTGVYFKDPSWGVRNEPIKAPLSNTPGEDVFHKSISVFKLILRFMNDEKMSEKRQKMVSDYIVQMGLQNEGLRDELYCQLINQTWKNQKLSAVEKGWLLMAMCLSCFPSSSTLFKYLLKYVSDVGINGYKVVCQHKALQCANILSQLSRVYPPCYLEWMAAQRKANMALEVKFPDDVNMYGHIESWTSGELFTSHLLKMRGLPENCHGWTVVLQNDTDFYELMGYDYVLDLISEMEIAPGFPVCKAYFLVSTDRSKERIQHRRHLNSDLPHNPDRERLMIIVGRLPELLKRDPSKMNSGNISEIKQQRILRQKMANSPPLEDELGFSMTSVLNQRPTDIFSKGLSESKMNTRYTKRSGAVTNGNSNGFTNGDITTIIEDDLENELSGNRLNVRYFSSNGEIGHPELTGDLDHQSKLNSRYVKSGIHGKRKIGGGNRGKHITDGNASEASFVTNNTDFSHWVEDVFNNALQNEEDDLGDGRMLENRIRGGGKGIPGLQTQQTSMPLATGGFIPQMPTGGLIPQIPTSTIAPPTDALQQMVAQQQMQQQQQAVQAYMTQMAQAQRQQQEQQAMMQAALQQRNASANIQAQSQTTTSALRTALQQQELQNQLLKQSIEQEVLKQQLQQIQTGPRTTGLPAVNGSIISPASSFNSGLSVQTNQLPGYIPSNFGAASSQTTTNFQQQPPPPTAPKKVSFIKNNFESSSSSQGLMNQPSYVFKSQQSNLSNGVSNQVTTNAANFGAASTSAMTYEQQPVTKVTVREERSQTQTNIPHEPPPPPPPSSAFTVQKLHSQPAIPPPPPPPPPAPTNNFEPEIDRETGTFTFKDTAGRARTIRIGRVVWPPPVAHDEHKLRDVGKLDIDEQVARDLEKMSGKSKWKPPAKPADEPKSILKKQEKPLKRGKSLVETTHMETLRLLEVKLGGVPAKKTTTTTTTETAKKAITAAVATKAIEGIPLPPPPPPAALPPPLPDRPPPTKPSTIQTQTEKIEKVSETVQAQEPIYETHITQEEEVQTKIIDYATLERVMTELFPQQKNFFLTYSPVPWKLHVRKEVFLPQEKLDNQLALHLIYCQVVQDVYNNACIRITKEDKTKMKSTLDTYGVSNHNVLTKEVSQKAKKIIVDTAKEWPTYFCRLFPVASTGHYSSVKYLGVSHTGLRLVTRERTLIDDHLSVLEEIRFEDVVDCVMPSDSTIQLDLKTKSVLFYTPRAKQLKNMIDKFCAESEKGNKFVVALRDYITRESTLLSFKRGDIIKLMDPEMHLDQGWLYGSLNGIVGIFPSEYVKVLLRHEVEHSSTTRAVLVQRQTSKESRDDISDASQGSFMPEGKYSMIEFAIMNFRETIDKYEMLRKNDGSIRGTIKMIESLKLRKLQQLTKHGRNNSQAGDWSWKEQAELIKWTRSPIQASLLKLTTAELNKMALECFICIMRFMGDYPMNNRSDVDCVIDILRCCHKYPELRDEIFCQLCKQTTNNRSMKPKSAIRGWRLFGIVAAFCDCSDTLRPYLFKYLETNSSDISRPYSAAATLCLQNLRKTFRYGGRKNVPLREEIQALGDGRNCKRFPFVYSGSNTHGGMLQVKSCTVVLDAIEDICRNLSIVDPVEFEEYTLFLRSRDGGIKKLGREEYILDITSECLRKKIEYDLIFQRTVWFFPVHHNDNEIYINLLFQQCVLDYLDGLLIEMPNGVPSRETMEDIVTIGALLYKSKEHASVPSLRELDTLLPANVLNVPGMRPQQWLNRIHSRIAELPPRPPMAYRAQFIDILSTWKLFGSTFFHIKSIPNVTGQCILAVNRNGIHFLRHDTREVIVYHPFVETLSTRRYRSDYNVNYLDMKVGNLMVQKIMRVETDQGSDISNMIGQYMQVINRHRKRPDRPSPSPY